MSGVAAALLLRKIPFRVIAKRQVFTSTAVALDTSFVVCPDADQLAIVQSVSLLAEGLTAESWSSLSASIQGLAADTVPPRVDLAYYEMYRLNPAAGLRLGVNWAGEIVVPFNYRIRALASKSAAVEAGILDLNVYGILVPLNAVQFAGVDTRIT